MSPKQSLNLSNYKPLVLGVLLLGIASAAWATRTAWLPQTPATTSPKAHADSQAEEETPDDHVHHDEATSITLSSNGLKNIGYEPIEVRLGDFVKKLSLPAIVAERPGRSRIHITATITGIVTEIHVVEGEALEANSPMFKLRLTDDELVTVQREYLRTAESLNVLNHEIARLKALGEGVVAGRRILEQEYEKQKLEASLLAEQQALVVHGISQDQVEEILKKHQLLRDFLVRAPDHFHSGDLCQSEHLFHVQSLPVSQGQQVSTGQDLAVLADHCQLYVEGRAFEDDATGLREAARNGWEITANLLPGNGLASAAAGLKLLYLADRIDPESRAFRFYLQLPNEVVLDQTADDGRRYLEWHYKPGQRMQLAVPVQRWEQQLVLPVTAVVDEGGEVYVYRQNGGQFDRVSVHVVYRDQNSAVVENNGSLFPGDIVAGQGAYQMHLALKNKSSGGVDPHAGHNH
jgi:multidrug efflux pump subunit AcrA (membrane-fusion protein)